VPPGLEVDQVSKGFPTADGYVLVLDRVSLQVQRGRFMTLIGPTGCGKSTLLRVIAGLLRADSGTVSIFGESPSKATAAKHVGFVPQSPALLPWRTVLDNVRLPFEVNKAADARRNGARAQSDESDEAVRSDEADEADEGGAASTGPRNARSDPVKVLESFGLADVLTRKPGQLSMGMQQRVAIARAFVFDPAILLMDEPFSALDELTREHQRHELLDVWQSDRKTVLFVTHSVAEAVTLGDYVAVMSGKPGRITANIEVDLPRPRGRFLETTEEFYEVERRVRAELRSASGLRDGPPPR